MRQVLTVRKRSNTGGDKIAAIAAILMIKHLTMYVHYAIMVNVKRTRYKRAESLEIICTSCYDLDRGKLRYGMEISEEKKLEYKRLAVDTVISYAREQGVKLRHSDFPLDSMCMFNGNLVDFHHWDESELYTVRVFINGEGRWAAQLKKAGDGFLNYVNARVLKEGIMFSFSTKELDLLRMKDDSDKDVDMEKIISKITKLLALSDLERNPSESEAVSASLAAQRLLAKYNLSMADVTGERDPAEEIEQVIADVGTGKNWKYRLADVVANNYACKTFSQGSDKFVFYGYKADILIARRVYIYLFKVGNRLANQYVKKYRETISYDTRGIYNSFVSGFINGVEKELEKQCTALALIVQPEVQESWDIFSAAMGTRSWNIMSNDFEAYEEGFVEGKRALNAQYLEDDTRTVKTEG